MSHQEAEPLGHIIYATSVEALGCQEWHDWKRLKSELLSLWGSKL